MNTFSVNSLKLLEKNEQEFINKYILHLDFLNKNEPAKMGERLHGFICYYLRGFNMDKIYNSLEQKEKEILQNVLKLDIFSQKEKFIKTEEGFLVKVKGDKFNFYLTGRFDAIYKDNDGYIIFDWKSKNIPQNPQEELQSVVYLYCASEIFNTQNIKIQYLSLEKQTSTTVELKDKNEYLKRICSIADKMPIKYLT